ncbi:hypothetical protein SLE2022_032740 [Rubroshorea leprosula]
MDANKSRKLSLMLVLFIQVLAATLPGCFFGASQQLPIKKPEVQTMAPHGHGFGSSLDFPVTGNVYPDGYFAVSLSIGNPQKPFSLDIDTGSDLTWVQCDAPCTGCTVPPDQLYKPAQGSFVLCEDPLCPVIQSLGETTCKGPYEQCHFHRSYADGSSVRGVLVRDNFYLGIINGTPFQPSLTFGCASDIQHGRHGPPPTTGLLGLGKTAANIFSQLRVENVIGHCYSAKGGGFMFIRNDPVSSSKVSWVPMSQNTLAKHYASGPADLLFGGAPTGIKGLHVIFDSGTTFTYFNSAVYEAILNLLSKDLKGKPIRQVQDPDLPVCWNWNDAKPFRVLSDVKSYFKPFTLSFTRTRNAQLQLTLENYLIIAEHGNACLGILDGTKERMGNINVIGDISMLDKLVIYDKERKQIGWSSANCSRIPKS